ncbi:MAG TPA: oligosaccharide flippase family protein [Patescibacteria group bacterium]|nr:oligosaccharide flippase family protein [Patescibacteria group bacterium]
MKKKVLGFIRLISAHSVVRNSIVVMGGSMVANVLAYLYHLIVGRILGPQGYGELAALLSLFYILNVPSTVVQTILTKFFSILKATDKLGEAKYLFFRSLWMILSLSFIGLGAVALSVDAVAGFLHIESKANFYWLYIIFALYFVGMVPLSFLAAYQRFFAQSALTALGMSLRLVFAVFAAPFGVALTLISNILANIITFIAYLVPLRFLFKTQARVLTLSRSRTIGYSVPTLVTTLAIAALYNQDVLLVKHFFSPTQAGIYSSLSVLGKVIFYASSAITFVLFPVISERKELKHGHTRLVGAALLFVAGLSSILTLFYFLFPTFVVRVLYGSSFDEAIPYVGLFGVFISLFTLDNILFSICLAIEKVKVWMIGLTAAIVQFALIWTYHTSLQTVIIANCIVAGVLLIALLVYYAYARESD